VFSKLELKTTGMNLQGNKHPLAVEATSIIAVGKFRYWLQISGSERVN